MSHEETLDKAIRKAIAGGWGRTFGNTPEYFSSNYKIAKSLYPETTLGFDVVMLPEDKWDARFPIETVIFNHDFARAIYGEFNEDGECALKDQHDCYDSLVSFQACLPWYKWHLQQMVISDDPIAYLGAHI